MKTKTKTILKLILLIVNATALFVIVYNMLEYLSDCDVRLEYVFAGVLVYYMTTKLLKIG